MQHFFCFGQGADQCCLARQQRFHRQTGTMRMRIFCYPVQHLGRPLPCLCARFGVKPPSRADRKQMAFQFLRRADRIAEIPVGPFDQFRIFGCQIIRLGVVLFGGQADDRDPVLPCQVPHRAGILPVLCIEQEMAGAGPKFCVRDPIALQACEKVRKGVIAIMAVHAGDAVNGYGFHGPAPSRSAKHGGRG